MLENDASNGLIQLTREVFERRDQKLENTTHAIYICDDASGNERRAYIDRFCSELR